MLEAHSWSGRRWSAAERSLWFYGGDVAGEYFTLEGSGLTFLVVRNSGHLLPMDVPEKALDMINRFISDSSFADKFLLPEKYYLDLLENSDENAGAKSDDASTETLTGPSSASGGLLLVFAATFSLLLLAMAGVKVYAHRSIDADATGSLSISSGMKRTVYSPLVDALPIEMVGRSTIDNGSRRQGLGGYQDI